MRRALGAGGLVLSEWTFVETNQGIVPKRTAFGAEFVLAPVVIVAVEADHGFNGFAFSFCSRMVIRHEIDSLY